MTDLGFSAAGCESRVSPPVEREKPTFRSRLFKFLYNIIIRVLRFFLRLNILLLLLGYSNLVLDEKFAYTRLIFICRNGCYH